MKKYLAILLVVVTALLSGCNSKTDIKDLVISDGIYFKKDLWGSLKLYNGKMTEQQFERFESRESTDLLTESTIINGVITYSISVDDSNHKRVEILYENRLMTKKIRWYSNDNKLSETNYKKGVIVEETSFFDSGIKRQYEKYVFFDPTSAIESRIEYDLSGAKYREWSYNVDWGKKNTKLRELREYKFGKKYSSTTYEYYENRTYENEKVFFPNGQINAETTKGNGVSDTYVRFPDGFTRRYVRQGKYGLTYKTYGLNSSLIEERESDSQNNLIKEEFGKDTLGAEQCFNAIWVENTSNVIMSSYWHPNKYSIIYMGFLRKPIFIIKDSTILDFNTKGIIARVSGNTIYNGGGNELLFLIQGKFYDINKNFNQYPCFADSITIQGGSDHKILFQIAGTDIYLGGTNKIAYTKCDNKMQKEYIAAFLLMQRMEQVSGK